MYTSDNINLVYFDSNLPYSLTNSNSVVVARSADDGKSIIMSKAVPTARYCIGTLNTVKSVDNTNNMPPVEDGIANEYMKH